MFPASDSRSPEERREWRQGEGATLWREGEAARAWVEKEVETAVWVGGPPPSRGLGTHGGSLKHRLAPEPLIQPVWTRPRNRNF